MGIRSKTIVRHRTWPSGGHLSGDSLPSALGPLRVLARGSVFIHGGHPRSSSVPAPDASLWGSRPLPESCRAPRIPFLLDGPLPTIFGFSLPSWFPLPAEGTLGLLGNLKDPFFGPVWSCRCCREANSQAVNSPGPANTSFKSPVELGHRAVGWMAPLQMMLGCDVSCTRPAEQRTCFQTK